MRKFRIRALPVMALSAMALFAGFLSAGQTAQAEEDEEYTYTVKLFAGNQGELTKGGVTASRDGKEAPAGVTISYDKDKATVKGLKYGDTVYINFQDAASVTDKRYYVKGVRRSGRDNSEATESTFAVGSDRDYVIAYGIKGDMVSYTVNYVDEDGEPMPDLPSDTYYGLPGEQQYVSARYAEGYQPQAYNLVKTLVQNEAENVFTFVYSPVTEPAPATPAPTPTPASTTTTPAPTTTTPAPAATTPAAATPETTAPEAAAPENPAAETPEDDGTVGGDQTTLPDEQTPQGTQSLDDEETPLGQQDLETDRPGTVVSYLPLYLGIGAVAAAALIIMGIYVYHKKKKAMASMSAQQMTEKAPDMHDGNQ